MSANNYEPVIVGFLCQWCSYTGADLAGTSRTEYPPNLSAVRVMCSGRVDPTFVIETLAEGADGVLIAGCHPGDCHYSEGNYRAMRRFPLLMRLLDQFGIDRERVRLEWISASEGEKFARVVTEMTEKEQTPSRRRAAAKQKKSPEAPAPTMDDAQQVEALLEKMKVQLPIPAEVRGSTAKHLRSQGISIPHHRQVSISSVLNSGDEGGILCAVSPQDSVQVVLISLTQLKIPCRHPLEKEIRAYQKARLKNLG